MKSFGLLRTNVALTTNIKLMVGSSYSLYMDSIPSVKELSATRFKKIQFNKDNYWDELVPYFFKSFPADLAFGVKYDNDVEIMSKDFSNQYDETYNMGVRNISNNKDYSEEYEYFAPLHIYKGNLPQNFIIFRVDGPGLDNIDRLNFREHIIDKLKCVKNFNLTRESQLGEFLDRNFVTNKSFPINSLYVDFRKMEFSSWSGIDYNDGGYSEKSFMMDSVFEYENTYLDLNKLVTDGWKNNKVVYPNIINFSFLFDDHPATKTSLRKWSINRYLGFYVESMDKVVSVSPNDLPKFTNDVVIDLDNIIYSPEYDNPFLETWKVNEYPYVEIDGNFYKIEKFEEVVQMGRKKVQTSKFSFEDRVVSDKKLRWRIVSDINLAGKEDSLNKNLVSIDDNNYIITQSGEPYTISGFSSADVWLIKIGDRYHNIVSEEGYLKLNTDWGFRQYSDKFEYYINDPDPTNKWELSLVLNEETKPLVFDIFKVKFSDIKDFDTDLVETNYARYEYETEDNLNQTDETKLHSLNLNSPVIPKDLDLFDVNGDILPLPISSEYNASNDLFRVDNNQLNDLWRKNPIILKWGYDGSLSSYNYPYLLNNCFDSEDFNRTVNPFDILPKRSERNLDYFYTVGLTGSYVFRSLEIDKPFSLGSYLGATSSDYFTDFFGSTISFSDGRLDKLSSWADASLGDTSIPNTFLLRGIKYSLYEVRSIQTSNQVDSVNTNLSNKFNDWKLSVILSKNDIDVDDNGQTFSSFSGLSWETIDVWKSDKTYVTDSKVIWNDSIYVNNSSSFSEDPNENPSNLPEWSYYSFTSSVFWSPAFTGTYSEPNFGSRVIYHYGDYYYYNGTTSDNFWNSSLSYSLSSKVFFKGKIWTSGTASNTRIPGNSEKWYNGTSYVEYWVESSDTPIWKPIELWNQNKTYQSSYVVYEEVVYWMGTTSNIGVSPDKDSTWLRFYSLKPDNTIKYSMNNNPIILMNGRYYMSTNSPLDNTLSNGINVYFDERWKNILINIYVNDNTLSPISFTERDNMYSDVFTKLSANNYISYLNDLTSNYDFSSNVKYIVINADNNLDVYNFGNLNSVNDLPYLLNCEFPDEFYSRINSYDEKPINLGPNVIKATKTLNNNKITNTQELNYYSDSNSIASSTTRVKGDSELVINYHGLKNNIYNRLYRFGGFYSPIFYSVKLFNNNNYVFNTDLSDFGMTCEHLISKVNRLGNTLKLKNSNVKSIYPQMDEFGYTYIKRFIFKSTWDFEYFIECIKNDEVSELSIPIFIQPNTNENMI